MSLPKFKENSESSKDVVMLLSSLPISLFDVVPNKLSMNNKIYSLYYLLVIITFSVGDGSIKMYSSA